MLPPVKFLEGVYKGVHQLHNPISVAYHLEFTCCYNFLLSRISFSTRSVHFMVLDMHHSCLCYLSTKTIILVKVINMTTKCTLKLGPTEW